MQVLRTVVPKALLLIAEQRSWGELAALQSRCVGNDRFKRGSRLTPAVQTAKAFPLIVPSAEQRNQTAILMVHDDDGPLNLLIVLALFEKVVVGERLLNRFLRLGVHRRINFVSTAVQLVFGKTEFFLGFFNYVIFKGLIAVIFGRWLIIVIHSLGLIPLFGGDIAFLVH
ncbi:hypothetical protein D1872_243920 [compost metagenome]